MLEWLEGEEEITLPKNQTFPFLKVSLKSEFPKIPQIFSRSEMLLL